MWPGVSAYPPQGTFSRFLDLGILLSGWVDVRCKKLVIDQRFCFISHVGAVSSGGNQANIQKLSCFLSAGVQL